MLSVPADAGWIAAGMVGDGHLDALVAPTDDGWWVCARDARLVFRDGQTDIEVAIDPPLRWTRDGRATSFDDALATVPEALHGWMALAALIGLRHCVVGLATGASLPAGMQEWPWMARRAAALETWMLSLAELDGVDLPVVPDGIDDGLDGPDGA
jgi:hypothetical protein